MTLINFNFYTQVAVKKSNYEIYGTNLNNNAHIYNGFCSLNIMKAPSGGIINFVSTMEMIHFMNTKRYSGHYQYIGI
jgi:hypothetical protein